jgi:glycosyltransferase involved in cell wall biosynthesis
MEGDAVPAPARSVVKRRRRANLLIIGPLPAPKGGVSVHIERLREALRRRGVETAILDESRVAKPGVPNLRRISPWRYARLLLGVRAVHIHSGNLAVRLAHTVAARLLGRRVIHTLHSFKGGRLRSALAHLCCRLATRNVLVNERLRARFDPTGAVIPAFIPPGAADEETAVDIGEWIVRQKAAGRRVVTLNGFQPELYDGVDLYGYDLLIDAFADARIRSGFAGLIVVSSLQIGRDYFESLGARIERAGLGGQVLLLSRPMSFCGVLRASDVLVRPTTSDGDALSIREALWYGRPVVASDAVWRPEGTILFRSRDAGDLAAKLLVAVEGPPPAPLNRDFSTDLIAVYDDVLGARVATVAGPEGRDA